MISPSQRRRQNASNTRNWTLHRRIARTRDLHRHLFLASALALVAALATWAFGLDLATRAGVSLAAAAAAWLIPVRRSEEWALSWIGERAGLAYETALELGDKEDRFGIRSALEERADASLSGIDRPSHSAWWLPLLALALGALLLPALPMGTGGSGLGGIPAPPGSTAPAPVDASSEDEEIEEPNLPEEERLRANQAPAEGEQGDRGAESDAEGDGQAGERQALERYLQNLRERPEQEEEPEGQEEPAANNGRAPGGEAPESGEQRDGGGNGEEGEQAGEGEGNRAGQGEPQAGEQGEQGEGEGQQEQQQNPFGQTGTEEEPADAQAEQPQEQGEQLESGAGQEGQEGEGNQSASSRDPEEGGTEDGLGDGAGGRASPEEAAGLAGETGQELQLEGELQEGPLTSGGTVQLPGGDEVELPPGRTADTYAREVERAVTEGRVPLEYQEIIRNYFR